VKLLLKLAWRNLWRNKRRSLITLAAIAFATFAAIAMRGMQKGTYAANIKHVVNMFSGYLQIQNAEYNSNPSLRKNFKVDEKLIAALNSNEKIISYSLRLYADGLISYKDNSQGAIIFAVDPIAEKNVTTLESRTNAGSFLSSDSTFEIVLGHKLLDKLNAEIGNEIVLLAQGFDGSLGNMKFKIVGTSKLGIQEFDGMSAFIGLKTAQELTSMYNRIHAIAVKIDNLNDIDEVKASLSQSIDNENLAVLSWDEVMPDFKQSIALDNISGIFMLMFLIIIVAFGILNTILMSVTERFNEFGITLSIGMPQLKLVLLIVIETIALTAIGLIIGNILGWFTNYYLHLNPIEFASGEYGAVMEDYGWLPIMPSSIEPMIFINTSLIILFASLLSCLYPAYKVFKLEPLKGIRYT
jgi:ABC-type lipoprotein release transport system permease subunit